MRKMLVFTLTTLLILAIALTGCGNQSKSASSSTATPDSSAAASSTPAQTATPAAAKEVDLQLYYPVSVGGPIADKINSYVDEFNKANEGKIKVNAIFAGSYTDTMTKVKAAIGAHKAPDMAILLQTDIFDLTDLGYVEPLDSYVQQAGADYINDFYPALLDGSMMKGHRYSMPFQRSTQVMFYNKKMFSDAHIEHPPTNWQELIDDGKKLTKMENGKVATWGFQVPVSGFMSYWNIQPFALQNGVELANPEGTKVQLDNPKTIEALQFFYDLANKYKIMPAGEQQWGDIPTNFLAQKAAMVLHSTGSLTNIMSKASFEFGVAPLPTQTGKKTNLGGGNIYIMKDIPQENKDAAWKFIQFVTTPEKVADWSMASGYIATRKSAYETPVMKDFVQKHPEYLVARDELKDAGPEFATHNDGKVVKDFSDEIMAVVSGQKKADAAMKDAQKKAEHDLQGF